MSKLTQFVMYSFIDLLHSLDIVILFVCEFKDAYVNVLKDKLKSFLNRFSYPCQS